MALKEYNKKRDLKASPEPAGGKPHKNVLRFVVQQHAASSLHYDFRLELKGVLKSWAVPKGPSMNPDDKRLAIMVEDHPYDYKDFEGIIPEGNYGAGAVIVWDEGEFIAFKKAGGTKKEMEQEMEKELKRGKLEVQLHGEKLKGNFVLIKSNYQGQNSWLLKKMEDEYAKTTDILKKNKSVKSGKTLKQLEKEKPEVKKSTEKKSASAKKSTAKSQSNTGVKKASKSSSTKKTVKSSSAKKSSVKKNTNKKIESKKPKGRKAAMPKDLKPMLATLTDAAFDDNDWTFEVKWDGYRAIAYLNNDKVSLSSRNLKSFTEKFYPVTQALKELNLKVVLDGEVIVANENGISDFGKLQNWRSESDGELLFYVFDILWKDGYDLTELPLSERRDILKETLPGHEQIILSEQFDEKGIEFYKAAEGLNLEGIMAKRLSSIYNSGDRSKDWLKIKINKRAEMVIGGYTRNKGSSKKISALLAGDYEDGKLIYKGKIGTGFNTKDQTELLKLFKNLERKTAPFEIIPDVNKASRFRPNPPNADVTWLKPEVVVEVAFTEMTSDGVMRHPSYKGLREDKKPKEVHPEIPVPVEEIVEEGEIEIADSADKSKHASGKEKKTKSKAASKTTPALKKGNSKERKTLLNPHEKQQEKSLNGEKLKFTNLGKIYWPKEKYTKRDLLNYYYQAAPFILPHLHNRPQSLYRFPNGIAGKGFYQKNVTGKVPEWIEKFPYISEGEKKNYMVCTNEASLMYMANLGCISMNPWSSNIKNPDQPDFCIIDLDPDKNDFNQVIETARVVHQVLQQAGIEGYCKTSGSTGMHILIPLGAKYDYEISKEFGRLIATIVNEELPDFTSIERATAARKGKIYIDFLQNRPQATIASVYSVREKPGATVSMPLHWDEVKKGLKISDFTIKNAIARLREMGDIFKPVLGKGINIEQAIKKLQ